MTTLLHSIKNHIASIMFTVVLLKLLCFVVYLRLDLQQLQSGIFTVHPYNKKIVVIASIKTFKGKKKQNKMNRSVDSSLFFKLTPFLQVGYKWMLTSSKP